MSSHQTQNFVSTTRATLLTAAGRSAVAVVAVAGAESYSALKRCFRPASDREWKPGDIRFGHWVGTETDLGAESVVVTPLSGDSFEVHCHGGPAATGRILDDLKTVGVMTVSSDQWVRQTSESLLIAEANEVLNACQTSRTAAIALDQVRGAMANWAAGYLRLGLKDAPESIAELHQEAYRQLEFAPLTCRLAEPFRVVLSGPVNVGKSSLVNAIVGYDRSITLNQAGTTRDVLHAETVIEGIPIRLSDTAGLREDAEVIEREGISRARSAVESADLVISVRQPGTPYVEQPVGTKVIEVLNKADLRRIEAEPIDLPGGASEMATVATQGEGVEALMRRIVAELAEPFPPAGSPTPINQRQAGIVRQISRAAEPDELIALLGQLISGGD